MGWLNKFIKPEESEAELVFSALGKSLAVIDFKPDGSIIEANNNFLMLMGYRLDEVQGRHHSMFLESEEAASAEYQNFWLKLGRGEFVSAEFKRITKNGEPVWIQASYNPVIDNENRVIKVVKFASNVTQQKQLQMDLASQVEAIGKSQAKIEFDMKGIILDANEHFCQALGYTLDEIRGQHHSMFAEPDYAASHEYQLFW